jgi:hypothetical protein
MWFVFDSKERNVLYAKFETEFEARMYAKKNRRLCRLGLLNKEREV